MVQCVSPRTAGAERQRARPKRVVAQSISTIPFAPVSCPGLTQVTNEILVPLSRLRLGSRP
jgi:hypothetical protein